MFWGSVFFVDLGDGEEKRIPDDELSSMINEILNDNDRNRDGYIDYAEFIMSQRSEGES